MYWLKNREAVPINKSGKKKKELDDANRKEVCIVLDDSSRCILAGEEFDAATAQTNIDLIKEILVKFGSIRKIEQVIKDRGTQFCANKRDSSGNSESRFESFLKESEIEHIKSGVNHPQTNGKVEKCCDLYKKQRDKFDSFDNFVNWYNTVRYHESLDTKHYLQTPYDAFLSRLPEACKLNLFFKLMEIELNE